MSAYVIDCSTRADRMTVSQVQFLEVARPNLQCGKSTLSSNRMKELTPALLRDYC